MSRNTIQEQIDTMPAGSQKDLADYMEKVYAAEASSAWVDDPRYDLLNAPIWTPPAPGEFSWSDAAAITQIQHDRLAALRKRAGGWFYRKAERIVFVSLAEWDEIKEGRREP